MTTLQNPPERHIDAPHPFTQFISNHEKKNPPITIHKDMYEFIHQTPKAINIHTLIEKFPFLPNNLLNEALRIHEPLNEYTHPPPIPQIPPLLMPNGMQNDTNNTQIILWNASSLNTTLPNLQDIIQHIILAIITIQETKLSPIKFTKYIQNLFPYYKLIFNNTHVLTIQQRIPYTAARGDLLTLINQKRAFLRNITKLPSLVIISPYLQIIHIKNYSLQSWLILHLYMPSHIEDIRLVPTIQQTIRMQINAHPNHTYVLCRDFNRDIALIGCQNKQRHSPPQEEDFTWKTYTESLSLTYIPTNTNYSRQGGLNYTHTSLIDDFYIKTQNPNIYASTTLT